MAINTDYKYSEITDRILACAIKVHKTMGPGFQEAVYQYCLSIEFSKAGIAFSEEPEIRLFYDNIEVGKRRVDFLIESKVLLEIKATTKLEDVHLAQALNYLKAYKLEIGLLLNFGKPTIEIKRLINQQMP